LNWQGLDQWQQWILGIGGSLAAGFIVWLGRKLISNNRGGERSYSPIEQNASPILTQAFQPTINIHAALPGPTPRDPVRHVSNVRPEELTTVVRDLWKHFFELKNAFWALPKLGGMLGQSDPITRRRASADYVDQYNKTVSFLHREIIIPEAVAKQAKAALKIAEDEAMRARFCQDPFAREACSLYGERTLRDLLEQRSTGLIEFTDATDRLHTTIRTFLEAN